MKQKLNTNQKTNQLRFNTVDVDIEMVTRAFDYGEKKGRTEQQKHSLSIAYLEGFIDCKSERKKGVGPLVEEISRLLRVL